MSDKTLGQVAFEAYRAEVQGVAHDGSGIPPWEQPLGVQLRRGAHSGQPEDPNEPGYLRRALRVLAAFRLIALLPAFVLPAFAMRAALPLLAPPRRRARYTFCRLLVT